MAAAVGRIVQDDGAWDEIDATDLVGFTMDPGFRVVVTYKRVNGAWRPWTLVTQSAALKAKGIAGRGLYMLQNHCARRVKLRLVSRRQRESVDIRARCSPPFPTLSHLMLVHSSNSKHVPGRRLCSR